MAEEIKERLSKTEYDKVGEMLLELIAECPYIPEDTKIKYQELTEGKCLCISPSGGNIKKRNVLGGFTAEIAIQIIYQSFPTSNQQTINAQAVVDDISGWLEDVKNFPKLTDNREITKITSSASFSDVVEVKGDKSTVYVANVTMEYEVD